MRHAGVAIALLTTAVAGAPLRAPAAAQGIDGQVGRFYEGGGWDVYRLGVSRPMGSVFGLGLHGDYLRRSDGSDGGFAGLSADLTALKGGGAGPYLVAGVGAGMGSPRSGGLLEPLGIVVRWRRLRALSRVVSRLRRGGPLARALARPS